MKKIYIAEDDKNICEILTRHLSLSGYDTEGFADGESLLFAYKENPCDLIITDIMMPKMNGYDLCKEIRKESMITLIMISANNDEVDRILGLELGSDDYIGKPNSVPLSIIKEECARIKDILENLIFLSKIDSNVESFSFENCDVVNLVTMSVEKLESIAILNDIDIVYNPPEEIIISCDKAKLLRAFINIISNALKYTKDLVEIEIKEENEFVIITVSDNGAGFDDDKIDKLFLTTTGETVDGNGIGLLIVNEVIKNHNGEITVQNNTLGGAEIILKLPK